MPKSSSKRKKEKNADFKKTKLKVGQKKAVADNFTDTSFKSKAISLPSQSISHDKTALLTNSRNATFAELMTQLKHYSPGTRKDALLGLRDLFHRHPHLLPLHLGVLVNSVVRLLIDDSSVVRKALQTFLAEFIPMLHSRDVHPFLPLLIVYTCSAMTHILEDIREDALKFMDLWVAAGGQIVVNGFWDKIIPNYLSLLTSDSNATNASKMSSAMSFSASATSGMVGGSSGAGSASSASKTVTGASTGKNAPGSQKAKSEVLQSLAGFLQEGLGGEGGDKDPYWFLRNFLETAHARKSFNTTRTHLGGHDDLVARAKKSKKRKAAGSSAGGRSNGRSMRRKSGQSSASSSEEDSDDSEEQDSDSDQSMSEAHLDQDEPNMLNPSPVVSFNRASIHSQLFATFPIHPSAVHSSMTQAIWGEEQGTSQDPMASASIPIRIFPQQGGASASGAGANVGVSGSGKTGGDKIGGVQGRLAQIRPLITTLHPLLLSVWLDTAPTVFASTTNIHANHALTIVHLVLKIWGILWRAALARPKKRSANTEEEREQEREEERWLDDFLQSLLRHVLIYFPFGKDTVGMTDAKVASILLDMNTTYCELTSLFLLGSGVGRIRRVHKDSLQKSARAVESSKEKKNTKQTVKSSYRPSNKSVKKRNAVALDESSASDDYDSEQDEEEAEKAKKDNMVSIQVETPAWADQVVDFVLDALGWTNSESGSRNTEGKDAKDSSSIHMTSLSTDFKSQHLVALLPTLWTLLNCLETQRREWVFEALMAYFDHAHVQSGSKKIVLQFLALVIKLQSHPHYTGSFGIMVPGARSSAVSRTLAGLSKRDRKEKQESIHKLSKLLSTSLLKLPKLLWDLGTERIETSQTILDLLAWVTVIAGESQAGAAEEAERVQFLKTLQSYMALFFCVTVAAKAGDQGAEGGKRTVMGPFVKLPLALQRRAIEIVFYSGVVYPEPLNKKSKKDQQKVQQVPLLAAVTACCRVGDLSEETRLYIRETLRIM
ncbi:hypothetical protein BGZ51_003421 [Haplosporangium sp. Z 767]|nr:hypothetical protein BGZ50_009704 [Haplosporangium sp. Z 11]KAF9193370.1 hypothetical protein BGZ51_003421 [Haplosporangium sp. Z 767]